MKRSKQKAQQPKNKSPAPPKPTQNYVIWGIIIVAVVALATMSLRKKESRQRDAFNPPASPEQTGLTNRPATGAAATTDFQKLKGRWLRPDGGYVIDIRAVDGSGKLDASYLNPKSIHVAKAEAKQEGSAMKVFIELQDVNYPGSTYTLVYVPERDLLAGVYYQALQQQSFEVYFERMK